MISFSFRAVLFAVLFAGFGNAFGTRDAAAQNNGSDQGVDEAYGAKILEYTTDPRFVNPMVDHLPASNDIPSPLDEFGTIIGAPDILHTTAEIHGYLKKLADSSPRVMVRSIGESEEGREMIEVIVSSEANLSNLENIRTDLNKLADPRTISNSEADRIVSNAVPIYYITAGLHSPETGSPEMVMEMAYRLAVSNDAMIQDIRNNVVLIVVPVVEVDGRDRIVDTYKYRSANRNIGPSLRYWGAYAAHDNNRDGFGMALNLTRNILGSFMHWKPQVMHDLHESVSYLYTSTGLGPYNEYVDAITVNEWHNLAHEEVSELTSLGMPGVWTHAFYNGWAANYLIWMANVRNSNGRFYETFGNSIPETVERKLTTRQTSREWYRSNPPLEKTMWSLRNNTNYMQSGVLAALKYIADNREETVANFYLKSVRSLEKGKTEAPYAWVIPHDQSRPNATTNLVNLLMDQGLEVHTADSDLQWDASPEKEEKDDDADDSASDNAEDSNKADEEEPEQPIMTASAGDYVVRMDQPYRNLAQVLLDKQEFPKGANPPYDDTGWTLPYLHQVRAIRVADSTILDNQMTQLSEHVAKSGGVSGGGKYYVVNNTTDDEFAVFRFRLPDVKVKAAQSNFSADGQTFNAGSFIIDSGDNKARALRSIGDIAVELGVAVHRVESLPEVAMHDVEVARVGLIHTWVSTPQDAGWWHFAFDKIGIPYTYLSEQDLATVDLSKFDVLIMPRTGASPQSLVAGNSMVGDPVPWKKSDQYPSLGQIDETDDVRKGMGYEGLANLKRFVERGGVFITEGSTSAFPIDMAITRRVSIKETKSLAARGSVVRTVPADSLSPIVYGIADSLAAYFSAGPVFSVNKNVKSYRNPDWYKDEQWSREVPRTVLSFAKKNIGMSGMLSGESEMAGAPAVLDVPVGDGHVVLFAIRPVRRWNTQGSHALVFNTILHWNDLRIGWPDRPDEDEEDDDDDALMGTGLDY